MYFSLPFNLGVTYTVSLSFPFDLQGSLSLLLTGGTLVSFSSQVLTFTASQLTSNSSIVINNLLTAASKQPTTITVNITYQGAIYFYGSTLLAMTQIRLFNYVNVVQSNQIVYSPALATITLSGLSPGDKILLVASYSYFYASSQANCSSGVITCSVSSTLTVLSVNSSGYTTFTINMQNLGYVGQAQLNLTSYDSMQIYAKQSSIFTLATITTNVITIVANQTNPYLEE